MTTHHTMRAWLLLALVSLAACSGSARQPEWLNNPHSHYAAETHFTAVGQGSSRALAGDRALANLAKQFAVAVDEASVDITRSHTGSALPGLQTEQEVARELRTQTRQLLEGASVVEYWEDPAGEIHALAVLDRVETGQRLRRDIQHADREIGSLLSYASTTADNPVTALHALRQARQAAQQREATERKLMVVSGQGMPSAHPLAEVDATLRNALATLRVSVQADSPVLRAALEDALIHIGVGILPEASLRLVATLDTAPPYAEAGWHWLRGAYALSLQDQGRVLSQLRRPLKLSARDPNLLEQRAKDEMGQVLPDAVMELFTQAPSQ